MILEFIRKLAEYGDISDEVFATEDDVRAALFGPRRVAEAVLAYAGSDPVGFALYSYGFASFHGKPGIYIEDFLWNRRIAAAGLGRRCWCSSQAGRRARVRAAGMVGLKLE